MEAELLLDMKHSHGETARWCHRSRCLYWTDIEGERLWRYDPASLHTDGWDMPERLATFSFCEDNRYLLLGLASGLAFFDFVTGSVTRIAPVEAGLETRINDGRSDRQGRFVFGTQHEADDPRAIGGLYRLGRDLSVEALPLGPVAVANSIAFSPDGATMYYCDSPRREILCCDYPADDAPPRNARVFARLSDDDAGVPDGSAVDAQGGVWNARFGGGCIVRYDAAGRQTARIDVPTSQPSCVAFGGVNLDILYVTTARGSQEGDPVAGGIFAAPSPWHGMPCERFAGHPA
jgi:L-arabinonolactonase